MLKPPCVLKNFTGVASSFTELGEDKKALAAANKAYELLLERTDLSKYRRFVQTSASWPVCLGDLGEDEKELRCSARASRSIQTQRSNYVLPLR